MSLLIDVLIVLILLQVIIALEVHRLIEHLELVLVSIGESWFFLVRYHVVLLDVVV
jgi:hypothetical protein